jgi:PPE-repeat protein
MDKRVSDKLMLIICGILIVLAIVLTVSYVLIREHESSATPEGPTGGNGGNTGGGNTGGGNTGGGNTGGGNTGGGNTGGGNTGGGNTGGGNTGGGNTGGGNTGGGNTGGGPTGTPNVVFVNPATRVKNKGNGFMLTKTTVSGIEYPALSRDSDIWNFRSDGSIVITDGDKCIVQGNDKLQLSSTNCALFSSTKVNDGYRFSIGNLCMDISGLFQLSEGVGLLPCQNIDSQTWIMSPP